MVSFKTPAGKTFSACLQVVRQVLKIKSMLVGTYVKERDNNRIKSGKTGVIFWSKVYCLFIRDISEAYIFYINGR